MVTLNTAASTGSPYRIPPEPSRLPSILLAAAMHAILVAFLWVGIKWQNNAPVAVEAEVWDMKTQAAAPPAPTPVPAPESKPDPEPPRPVKAVEPPPAPKPDIALERQKQKELKQKQLAEEKLEREREEKLERQREELKEKKELEKKLAAEKKAAEKAEKLAKAKQAAEEQKKFDKLRAADLQRITGAGSVPGGAPKATAPRIDSGYLASITSKIKSTTSYLGSTDVAGNPRVQFKVDQSPSGEIMSVRLVKSSGLPAFDEAVEKGIIKSSPLPKKKDGTVERTLEIGFSMKDLN